MKIVNRGYIVLTPKQAFWNWANQQPDLEISFDEHDDIEPTVYLIEEDFLEEQPILEQHFKKIFKNELSAVNPDEKAWPEKLSMELFQEWFRASLGSTVFDTLKADLNSEKI